MELFRLLGTIAIQNESAIEGIKETTNEAEKAEGKMSKTFSKIGAVAKKVAIASAAAVGTATVAITKKAVEAYADYEQLVGGVETLFKDSSGTLLEYANNAYKTAGLSANEYMETVTSFSASLLQSLGGDTEKAANYADMAITDMSDNANKMGTSMEMIQNAYQGFAKQNYTMLDNLKLGYGGTQEEMKRLLADAEAISGIKYDISSYADVVDAIHVIQNEMGITGTTAKEASETISGSIAAAKGAWQNFLVGLADGTQNMDVLVGNLAKSVVTVGKNLIPRITTTLKSIGSLAKKYVPEIINGIIKQLKELGGNIKDKLPEIVDMVLNSIVDLTGKMKKKAPDFFQAGLDFIVKIAEGLMNALPTLIQKAPVIVSNLAGTINDNAPKLITTALQLIKTLALGLIQAIPTLIANIPKITKALFDAFMAFNWLNLGGSIITSVTKGLKGKLPNVKAVGQNILKELKSPFEKAHTKIKAVMNKVKSIFPLRVGKIFSNLKVPKINVYGGKIPYGIGGLGVKPTINVKWNAMGAIFKKPTIFNTTQGLQGVGEAGAEAVAPIDTLQQYVAGAVASQNMELVSVLQGILSAVKQMDSGMYQNIEKALDNRKIQWNDRELGRLVSRYA